MALPPDSSTANWKNDFAYLVLKAPAKKRRSPTARSGRDHGHARSSAMEAPARRWAKEPLESIHGDTDGDVKSFIPSLN